MGLGMDSGIRVSKRSNRSSTRQTRIKPDNCVATAPVEAFDGALGHAVFGQLRLG